MSRTLDCIKLLAGLAVFSLLFASCQTAEKKEPEQKILSYSEESNLANKLTSHIERRFGAWREPRVERSINNIVKKLLTDESLGKKIDSVKVTLLSTEEIIIAPGFLNRIYISKGILRFTRYENELSYAIAQQLVLLRDEAVKKNYLSLQGQSFSQSLVTLPTSGAAVASKDPLTSGWFNKGGLFDFGEETYLAAEKEAVQVIYNAKFDPRGAIAFVQGLDGVNKKGEMASILPEFTQQVNVARNEVAKLSPLRDPVIKSKNFDEISKALKKAKK